MQNFSFSLFCKYDCCPIFFIYFYVEGMQIGQEVTPEGKYVGDSEQSADNLLTSRRESFCFLSRPRGARKAMQKEKCNNSLKMYFPPPQCRSRCSERFCGFIDWESLVYHTSAPSRHRDSDHCISFSTNGPRLSRRTIFCFKINEAPFGGVPRKCRHK